MFCLDSIESLVETAERTLGSLERELSLARDHDIQHRDETVGIPKESQGIVDNSCNSAAR